MGFILSVSTIPTRINELIKIIPLLKCNYKFFVINICSQYKRFGQFKIPKELLILCNTNKRIVFNFVDDFGAITKYIGGYNFIHKKKLYNDKLIIIDDDICYNKDLFYELIDDKTKDNITTGSGFNYDNKGDYIVKFGLVEMVEGYNGICFDYNQLDYFIIWYSNFYKHFDFKSDDIIDKYLSASFLGDDFIISNVYNDKWATMNGRKYVKPLSYGFNEDALQNNTFFGGNMGSYRFLSDNIKILNTFKLKYVLNKEINKR
jgi:hypothetical protein